MQTRTKSVNWNLRFNDDITNHVTLRTIHVPEKEYYTDEEVEELSKQLSELILESIEAEYPCARECVYLSTSGTAPRTKHDHETLASIYLWTKNIHEDDRFFKTLEVEQRDEGKVLLVEVLEKLLRDNYRLFPKIDTPPHLKKFKGESKPYEIMKQIKLRIFSTHGRKDLKLGKFYTKIEIH